MPNERGKWSRFKSSAGMYGAKVKDLGALGLSGAQNVRAGWAALGGNRYGGAFRAGAAEAFGFEYGGKAHSQYRGFMGLKGRAGYAEQFKKMGRVARGRGIRAVGGMAGKLAGKAIFPAFTAYEMYSGYQEGGILGAAGAGVEAGVTWGAFKLAGAMLGSGVMWGGAALAAGGYGYYALGEASQTHVKRLRHLEMGAPVKDPYGTAATLRARSMQALNSSAVNGRMAMGNEALMMQDSAYSRR